MIVEIKCQALIELLIKKGVITKEELDASEENLYKRIDSDREKRYKEIETKRSKLPWYKRFFI